MDKQYLNILGLHVVLGLLMFFFRSFGNIYFYGLVAYFFFRVISAKPNLKAFEIIKACAYVLGAEVILRMTGSGLFYESSKYLVIVFLRNGTFLQRISF